MSLSGIILVSVIDRARPALVWIITCNRIPAPLLRLRRALLSAQSYGEALF